jgi:hypothetical protein
MIHVAKQIWYWKLNGYIEYFILFLWLIFANLKGQQHQQRIFLKEKNQIVSN